MRVDSSDSLYQYLRTAYNVSVFPHVTFDWNMNRYADTVTANNGVMDTIRVYQADQFPISSIVNGERPAHKGIAKAIIGQAVVAEPYLTTSSPRFYVSGYDDIYKYWVSPDMTSTTGIFPTYQGSTTCKPTVQYGTAVKTNKIVIKTENSWATMNVFRVLTSTDGTTFTQAFNNAAITNTDDFYKTGTLALWHTSNGWTDVEPDISALTTVDVKGIRLEVDSMTTGYGLDGLSTEALTHTNGTYQLYMTDGRNSNFQLISIEAHYVADFTDRLISFDHNSDMSDTSEVTPIGTLMSNDGTVNLSNDDFLLSAAGSSWMSQASMFNNNVDVFIDLEYSLDGVSRTVRQATMRTNTWDEDSEGTTVSVALTDNSVYLNSVKPSPSLYTDVYLSQSIWQLLDSVGFNGYQIDQSDITTGMQKIPFFYIDGTQSVWEILDSIAQGTQTAIYFDAYGVLQIKTMEDAFLNTTPVWTLRGQDDGTELADIISIEPDGEYQSNSVIVNYSQTNYYDKNSDGKPDADLLWQADGDVVIRSSRIWSRFNVPAGYEAIAGPQGYYINISPTEAAFWPWSGKFWNGTEIMEYEGKIYREYVKTPTGNTWNYHLIKSQEDKDTIDAGNDYYYNSEYTGGLYVTKRGLWNTKQSELSSSSLFTSTIGPTGSGTNAPIVQLAVYEDTYQVVTG